MLVNMEEMMYFCLSHSTVWDCLEFTVVHFYIYIWDTKVPQMEQSYCHCCRLETKVNGASKKKKTKIDSLCFLWNVLMTGQIVIISQMALSQCFNRWKMLSRQVNNKNNFWFLWKKRKRKKKKKYRKNQN